MLDVSQIMKDLASMVHEQGDAIGELLCVCECVCVLNIDSSGQNKLLLFFLTCTPLPRFRFFDEEQNVLDLHKQC